MKLKITLLLLCLSFLSGCSHYKPITATVLDAETMKPIEGSVVMVEWTKKHGIGLYYTESYKVVEVVTDKNGKAAIDGLSYASVDPPDVAVYKPGYVTWSSRAIFPIHKMRKDFNWGDQTFKLERFKPEYSYEKHRAFFDGAINSSLGYESKKLIIDTFDDAEKEKRIEEMHIRSRSGDTK